MDIEQLAQRNERVSEGLKVFQLAGQVLEEQFVAVHFDHGIVHNRCGATIFKTTVCNEAQRFPASLVSGVRQRLYGFSDEAKLKHL